MPAICGVVVALLYYSDLASLQRFRVPGQRLFAVSAAKHITLCGGGSMPCD